MFHVSVYNMTENNLTFTIDEVLGNDEVLECERITIFH